MKNRNQLIVLLAFAATTLITGKASAQGCVAAHSNQRTMDQLVKSDEVSAVDGFPSTT